MFCCNDNDLGPLRIKSTQTRLLLTDLTHRSAEFAYDLKKKKNEHETAAGLRYFTAAHLLHSYISHEEALSSPPLYLSWLISSGVPYDQIGGVYFMLLQKNRVTRPPQSNLSHKCSLLLLRCPTKELWKHMFWDEVVCFFCANTEPQLITPWFGICSEWYRFNFNYVHSSNQALDYSLEPLINP